MATDFPKKGDDKKVSLRNSNFDLFDRDFAENIKENYPDIWNKGGNIEGNNQYRRLTNVLANGKVETETDEMAVRKREAWGARHFENKNIAGVIAQIKWLVVGSRGEKYMKDLVREEINKKELSNMKCAGNCKFTKKLGDNKSYFGLNFEVKEFSEDSKIVRGYASTNDIDRGFDVVTENAMKKNLDRYKEEGITHVPMLAQHKDSFVQIGAFPVDKMRVEDGKMYVEGEVVTESEVSKQIWALCEKGYLKDFSIGFYAFDVDYIDDVRFIRDMFIFEISIVAIPMNGKATFDYKNTKSMNGTYVSMKVKNKTELYDWFSTQGVDMEDENNLHCTISFSRTEFLHKIDPTETIILPKDIIGVHTLGDDGAVVMKFNSDEMQKRFNNCMNEGATYDYESYIPHITLTYNGKLLDLSKIKMPDFPITLHKETVEPLNIDWKNETITHNKGYITMTKEDIESLQNVKDAEDLLKNSGYSNSCAKAMISKISELKKIEVKQNEKKEIKEILKNLKEFENSMKK